MTRNKALQRSERRRYRTRKTRGGAALARSVMPHPMSRPHVMFIENNRWLAASRPFCSRVNARVMPLEQGGPE